MGSDSDTDTEGDETGGMPTTDEPTTGPVDPDTGETGDPPVNDGCVPDEALIDEGRACLEDDHCPCGAHCELGECVAACMGDGDCGDGQRCDAFGRCRGEGSSDQLPPPRTQKPPAVVPTTTALIAAPGAEAELGLRVVDGTGTDPVRTRLVARDGAEVDCGAGFVKECIIDVDPEVPQSVPVKGADDPTSIGDGLPATGGSVDIYGDGKEFTNVQISSPEGEEGSAVSSVAAGTYEGTAVLERSGVGVEGELGAPTSTSVQVPVEVRVHPGGTIEIRDAVGVLAPGGSLVGTIAGSNLQFPDILVASGEAMPGESFEVIGSPSVSEVVIANDSAGFGFALDLRYEGMLADGRAPQLRWRIAAAASDAALGSAPPVPADAVPTLDPETLAAVPLGWDAAVRSALTPPAESCGFFCNLDPTPFVEAASGLDAGNMWLDMCGMTETEVTDYTTYAARLEPGIYGGFTGALAADLPNVGSNPTLPEALALQIEALSPGGGDAAVFFASVSLPGWDVREVPCDFTVGGGVATSSSSYPDLTLPDVFVDRCVNVQAHLGCDIEDIGGVETTGSMGLYHDGPVEGQWSGSPTVIIDRVCRVPRLPTSCIEGMLCAEPSNSTARSSIEVPTLGDSVLDVVADSRCASGGRAAAIDADLASALPPGDPGRLTASEALEACIADVETLRTVAAPTTVGANGAGLNAVLQESTCLDGGRFAAALSWAADAAAHGEADWGSYPQAVGRDALLGRMLQRWLQIHRQWTGEAVQRGLLDSVIGAEPEAGDPTPLDPQDTLEDADRAWELFMLPRIAVAVDRARTDAWADPDYRDHLTNSPVFGGEQSVALPVSMLEALQTEVTLAARIVERGQLDFDESALEAPAAITPTLFMLQAVATDLEHRVQAEFGEPQWAPRYQSASLRLARETNRLFQATLALRRGDNPLGIDDSDLPLYFFGDETGAGGQFSAISDYLIGSGPGQFAYAPFLVGRADESLGDARASFNEQLDRDYQSAQSQFQQDTRINDIRDDYEDQLEELCGSTSGSYLDQNDFTGGSCYLDAQCVEAALEDDATYFGRIGAPSIGFHMCIGAVLEEGGGPSAGFDDPEVRSLAAAIVGDSGCRGSLTVNQDCGSTQPCLECNGGPSVPLSAGTFRLGASDPALISDAYTTCVSRWNGFSAASLPDGPDASLTSVLPERLDNGTLPECMAGSLGELAVAVLSAQQAVSIARAEAAEFIEAYDIAVTSCEIELSTAGAIESANADHLEAMMGLRAAKAVADTTAAAANGVKDCAATVAGADKSTPWGAISGGVASGAACAAGAVEVVAQGFSIGFEVALENADQAHDNAVTALENEGNYEVCMNDAKLELVGVETSSLEIEAAMLDLSSALLAMRSQVALANDQWAEGRDSVELESTRFARRPDVDLWLDESIDEYERRFRLARRAVYLAVRAVEYEFQTSLASRADVLAARTPGELEEVLFDLWSSSGTGGIGGNQPTELKVVISLKDQLLQLADESDAPQSELGLTDEERFSLLLQSERYAVYDEDGKYEGQQIPFSVVPFGTIGIGSTGGIGVLAGTDCAERVWSVNASIRGEDDLFIGSETSFARIDLLKRNTFFSQWCSPDDPDRPFQVASVRPSRNLFSEPGYGSDVANNELGVLNETQQFSRARIEAFFNVPVAELESDEYANGETSELAARGLYGDYALFIDAGIISRESSNGSRTDGLILDAIDDILLRLDYVSVAQ